MKFIAYTRAILIAAFCLAATARLHAQVVISQVYGGGGNSGATLRNDFVEVFNRGAGAADLSTHSIQYASATGTSWQVVNLSGTLAAGRYYLIQLAQGAGGTTNLPTPDATGTIAMSATNAKVALVGVQIALSGACPTTNVVDFIGYGSANCFEGAGAAPVLSNTTANFRAGAGCTDTNVNSVDFSTGTPAPRNTSTAVNLCTAGSNPSLTSGLATPSSVVMGNTTLLTIIAVNGSTPASTTFAVAGNLTPIGGSATQTFFDDGTNGDATAGDRVFSFLATVANGTTAGNKTINLTVTDQVPRAGTGTISFAVTAPIQTLSINTIQGTGAMSPFVGTTVMTSGIVTARKSNGFFLQTPDANVDADPTTSEGIFVFTSTAPASAATVGNSVEVIGTVAEFVPNFVPAGSTTLTELTNPSLTVLSTGNPLPNPIMLTTTFPSPSGSATQLERVEGMRVTVSSFTVVSPTAGDVTESSASAVSTGVFYGVVTGIVRPFREPGVQVTVSPVAGQPANTPVFDTNPELIKINTAGLAGMTALDVTPGAAILNITGPLDMDDGWYAVDPESALAPAGGTVVAPVPVQTAEELTIGHLNIERFYDTVNDAGADVVLTEAAFERRLAKASLGICNVLRAPDVLGIVEVENLVTLQALAKRVNDDAVAAAQPSPEYVAYLETGNDASNINVGFLIKSGRVKDVVITQLGKTLMNANGIVNDRPPVLLNATIKAPGSDTALRFSVIVNHLRSLREIETNANARIKRKDQAEFLAGLVQARQNENLVVLGDFNAFEFNDGYVDVIGTIVGMPTPADTVLLASPDLVNPNLTNLTGLLPAVERYSFNFVGNAQAIDHILTNAKLLPRLSRVAFARINADFPDVLRNDATRPERVSDHDAPVAYFRLPVAVSSRIQTFSSGLVFNRANMTFNGTVSLKNIGASAAAGPLYVFFHGLPAGVTLDNATGIVDGVPWITAPLAKPLASGQGVNVAVRFRNTSGARIGYTFKIFSGSF